MSFLKSLAEAFINQGANQYGNMAKSGRCGTMKLTEEQRSEAARRAEVFKNAQSKR